MHESLLRSVANELNCNMTLRLAAHQVKADDHHIKKHFSPGNEAPV